jgi:hypothetical protein
MPVQIGGEYLETIDTESGAQSLSVSGNITWVTTTLTRPGDTISYTAGDQVAAGTAAPDALVFDVGRGNGGAGVIVSAIAIDTFNQATKPQLQLMLFDGTAAPTLQGDNVAWAPTDADLANAFAKIEFSSWTVGGTTVGTNGNCFSDVTGLSIPFKCGAAVNHIWGAMVERGSYAPGSAEAWTIRLGVMR